MTQHVCSTYRRKNPTIRLVKEVFGNILTALITAQRFSGHTWAKAAHQHAVRTLDAENNKEMSCQSVLMHKLTHVTLNPHSSIVYNICTLLLWFLIRLSLQRPHLSRIKSSMIPHDEACVFNSCNLSLDSLLTWCFNERLLPGFTSCNGVARFVQFDFWKNI